MYFVRKEAIYISLSSNLWAKMMHGSTLFKEKQAVQKKDTSEFLTEQNKTTETLQAICF